MKTFEDKYHHAPPGDGDFYRIAFELANAGKSITLPSGEVHGNQALCDMLGYTQEEMDEKKWMDLTHPEDVDANRQMIEDLIAGAKHAIRVKKRYIHKNGSTVWADANVALHRNAAGEPLYFITTIIDISEYKHLEAELERKAREWQITFDATNDAIWILDREFRILRTNKKAETLFQCSAEDLIGRHCWEVVHKTTEPISSCPHVLAAKSVHRETLELPAENRCFQVTVDPIVDDAGQYVRAVHIISDITERKQAEEALREQELQYHHLADTGLALIWTAGTDKLCTYFNEPWLKFTGRTLKQELGNGWAEGIHPDDRDRCFQIYTESFDRREPFDMEYRLRNAAGDFRWIRDLGTPNYNSKGEFLGYIGHCFDVTAQKAAAEEIMNLNRELEQKVRERTRELQKTVADLEELNRVFVGRELRMAELKARIDELEKQKGSGKL